MNINELREAQSRFYYRVEAVIKDREELYQIRDSYVRYFNRNKIRTMKIHDYAIGVKPPKGGYNFCYTLERELDGLGRIIGATAFKFGVYYGRTRSDADYEYRFAKKFGYTYQEAFKNVKEAILNLLIAGEKEDIRSIADNPISPMVKTCTHRSGSCCNCSV